MNWRSPLADSHRLVPTDDSDSFGSFRDDETGLPLPGHVGSFGHVRRNHTHEGVDLYVPEHTPITAVEAGVVVNVEPFTGQCADPPSPWWEDTWAVLVEGESGVVLYGELIGGPYSFVGSRIEQGDLVGFVKRVLTKDKGRPMSMLHLELHYPGTRNSSEWLPGGERPASLRDPTPYLLRAIRGEP